MWFHPRNLTNWYLKWPIVLLKPEIYVYIYIHIYIYIFQKTIIFGYSALTFRGGSKPLQQFHPTKTHGSTEKNGNPFTPSAKLHSKKAGVMPKMPPKKNGIQKFSAHVTYVTLEVRPWKFNSYSPWKYICIYSYHIYIYIYISRAPKGKGASSSCTIIFQRWTVQLLGV